jgi:hypothetical protein
VNAVLGLAFPGDDPDGAMFGDVHEAVQM